MAFAKATFRPPQKPGAQLSRDVTCFNRFQILETTNEHEDFFSSSGPELSQIVGNRLQRTSSEDTPAMPNRNLVMNDSSSDVDA